jgi:hypothetical protein
MEMPFARVRAGIDQFLRIDAGGRRAGDIADVVGAGAARAQPRSCTASIMATEFFRFDLADLDVGAGRDMRVAAAVCSGEVGEPGELCGFQNSVRQPQAAHVGILVGRDVEQPK